MAAAVDYQNQAQADEAQDQPGKTHANDSQQQNQEHGHQQQHHSQQQHSSSQPAQQQATAGIPGKDDERKLFIGGLSRNTTDKELRDHFGKFGDIESISVKVDPHTGISRGFAFMVFTNPKTIDKLLASGEHYINKRKVRERPYHVGFSFTGLFGLNVERSTSLLLMLGLFCIYRNVVRVIAQHVASDETEWR